MREPVHSILLGAAVAGLLLAFAQVCARLGSRIDEHLTRLKHYFEIAQSPVKPEGDLPCP
jgi:hypothetical protein